MAEILKVFLLDDNDIDIVVNSKLIKLANFTQSVTAFNNCDKLVGYLLEHHQELATEEDVNVILLDIQMPNKDGFECLTDLVKLPQDLLNRTRIFMLSSSIDRNDIKRAEDSGMVDHVLEKPLDVYQHKVFFI